MELRELFIKYLQSKNIVNIAEKLNKFDMFYKCRFRNKFLSDELNNFCDTVLERKTKAEVFLDFIKKNYQRDQHKKFLDGDNVYIINKWYDYLNGLYPSKTTIIKLYTSGKQLRIIKNRRED